MLNRIEAVACEGIDFPFLCREYLPGIWCLWIQHVKWCHWKGVRKLRSISLVILESCSIVELFLATQRFQTNILDAGCMDYNVPHLNFRDDGYNRSRSRFSMCRIAKSSINPSEAEIGLMCWTFEWELQWSNSGVTRVNHTTSSSTSWTSLPVLRTLCCHTRH